MDNNKLKLKYLKEDYSAWKLNSLKDSGYFIIFNGFLDNNILRHISGGALKLYIFLGLRADNKTGESFYKISTMSEYFGVTERTIGNWMSELGNLHLVYRLQIDFNSVSHTFLQPYVAGYRGKKPKSK